MEQAKDRQVVKRRQVFYIPGYDPIHPRRYRELYRKESAAQSEISGYEIGIAARHNTDAYGWRAAAKMDGRTTVADIDVLVWSDIVRDSMSNSIPATYWQMLRTTWIYVVSGTLRRLMWMRKGPVIAALYPVGMLLAQLVIGLLVGALAVRIVEATGGWLVSWFGWTFALPWFIRWPVIFGVAAYGLRMFQAKDNKLYAYYLMHDYAYSARWKGAYAKPLEDRISVFREKITEALNSDVDEVLVVGHSSGSHLAVSVLADVIRGRVVQKGGPSLGFLSLGQVVPMVSFLPKADRLRTDLAFLSLRDEITWIDVTAPGDGCSFALCDPVAVSGVAEEGQKWPIVISAAFTQTLSPEKWQEMRWRFFRLHFQYLCAFDRPKDYDYFQITCGPLTLADRFRGRRSSKSRIDVVASKYTSTE